MPYYILYTYIQVMRFVGHDLWDSIVVGSIPVYIYFVRHYWYVYFYYYYCMANLMRSYFHLSRLLLRLCWTCRSWFADTRREGGGHWLDNGYIEMRFPAAVADAVVAEQRGIPYTDLHYNRIDKYMIYLMRVKVNRVWKRWLMIVADHFVVHDRWCDG